MELKARQEMNPEFLWDLSHLFSDSAASEKAFQASADAIPSLEALAGTLGQSPVSLKSALDLYFQESEKFDKVYIYAMLSKAADGGDTQAQSMMARATSLYARFASATAFISPELLSLEEAQLKDFLESGLLDPKIPKEIIHRS